MNDGFGDQADEIINEFAEGRMHRPKDYFLVPRDFKPWPIEIAPPRRRYWPDVVIFFVSGMLLGAFLLIHLGVI